MVKIQDKINDGFYACYLNNGDFLKIEIKEGKVVRDGENVIHIYCLAETGLSPDTQPLKITFHRGTYKGYSMQEKKFVDGLKAYEVEEYIFNQLISEDFPKDGFSGILIHHKSIGDYKKKQPISNIEESECKELPALPSGNGSGKGKGYSPKEYAQGAIEARSEFLIIQFNEFLALHKIEYQCKSISEIFSLIAKTSNENEESGEKMLQFVRFLAGIYA